MNETLEAPVAPVAKYNPTKMDSVFKRQWTDALRTGGYNQCTGRFHKTLDDGSKGHCCLGVAVDIMGVNYKDGVGSWDVVKAVTGLTVNELINLANMNDSGQFGFSEIADYIEQTH